MRDNQTIYLESLSVKEIQAYHGYSETDAALGQLLSWIQYYSTIVQNRKLVHADRYYPSTKMCSLCGHKLKDGIPTEYRSWVCPVCGVHLEEGMVTLL